MTCAEFKDLVAAYAIGALEVSEREAMDAHLAGPGPHEGCQAAMTAAHEAASVVGRALSPVRLDERLWKSIEDKAGLAPSAAPLVRRRLPGWTPWAVAAAASLAALYFGADRKRLSAERASTVQELVALQTQVGSTAEEVGRAKAATAQERERCERDIAELRANHVLERQVAALLEQPGTQVVALGPANTRRLGASAIVNSAQHRAFIMATALPVSAGHDYELWVIHGKGAPQPAGLMHDLGNGMMLGEVDAKLLATPADALAISLEPVGGNPTPTEVVSVGKLNG